MNGVENSLMGYAQQILELILMPLTVAEEPEGFVT